VSALRAAALSASAALLLAGCSSGGGGGDASSTTTRSESTPARKQDVAWLVMLRNWEGRLNYRSARATRVADDFRGGGDKAELESAVRPLERCAETLDEVVGEPVVARYRHSYGLYRTACESISDWARALQDASIDEQDAKETKALDQLDEADRALEASFLAVQPLPVKGGNVSSSRIEPRFGRALNRLVYKSADAAQIEVRCWSKEDWPWVKYEWGGYAGTLDFAGFAYDQFRISAAPEYCASLVGLVYGHERPTKGRALLQAAASVALLAHEGGHLYESETNEARTECLAVQRIDELGRILGLGGEYSDMLARVYWEDLYPLNTPAYKTELCRNGGPLDLHPDTDTWP
jgi:hypothetical protein